jgi:hemolysin III
MKEIGDHERALKPRLRGVQHQIAFFVALAAGTWLLTQTSGAMFWACLVYLLALCGQLGVSALYHRITWAPKARQWWRRLDHSFIMMLIAGTGTPLAVALPTDATRTFLLLLWGGAALGVLRALVWITAPKPLVAVLALALAWFSYPFMPGLRSVMGTTSIVWLLSGGIIYSLGAVAYALKWPDPWPSVFGYHEVFHTLVVVGAACHFVTVTRVVLGIAG